MGKIKGEIEETPSVVTIWNLNRVVEGGFLVSETGGNQFPLAKLIEKQKIKKKNFRCVSPAGN